MRFSNSTRNTLLIVLLVGAVASTAGCANRNPHPSAPTIAGSDRVSAAPGQFSGARARVTFVSTEHGFAVVDFSARAMPAIGTRLSLFRGDNRVGTVRITEPVRGRFATADVLEGEARVGDEVR